MLARFPSTFLADDEDLVIDVRPHWIALVVPAIQTILILTAVVLVWLFVPSAWGNWPYAVSLVAGLVLFLIGPARGLTRWATAHLVVTTDRVIRRSGLFAKETIEISLEKINDVTVRQSVGERLLRAGNLKLESAGRAGQEIFHDVPDPDRVHRLIFEMKERNANRARRDEDGVATGRGGWGPASIADELLKLNELRGQGVLTDEEFDSLKARLLRRV